MVTSKAKKILVVFGTRPEAIKLMPIIMALQKYPRISTIVCVTAQHRDMLDQVLELFRIKVNYDLNVMQDNQNLNTLTGRILEKLQHILQTEHPDWVIVQGDTNTTFAASLAAFYAKIPVAHIEAGLRTNNIYSPWPEEMNRKLVTCIAELHFAATQQAANNLVKENISTDKITITGNTVIDALLKAASLIATDTKLSARLSSNYSYLTRSKKLVLVTGHRRESFGQGFEQICLALKILAQRDDIQIVYPVHLNPNVQEPVNRMLGNISNIHLIEPVDYLSFVYLMNQAYLILTDSGGVQEEAPSLNKPVLIMRHTTERPEAILAGVSKLVGTTTKKIVSAVEQLLDNQNEYALMKKTYNPFGDGNATPKIVKKIINYEKN